MIKATDIKKIAAFVMLTLLTFLAYEGLIIILEASDSRIEQEENVSSAAGSKSKVEVRPKEGEEKEIKLVSFDNKKKQLNFYDQDGKLIISLGWEALNLENNFPVRSWSEWRDSAHIGQTVVRKGQQFLFPVATSFYCGANNCTWHLYSYNIGDPKPQCISKKIFGNVMKIIFSPDESKIAILSSVHGGHCNSGEYLYLLNRKSGQRQKIRDLNLEEYWVTHVDSLNWADDFTLKAEVVNLNCDAQDRTRYKRVKRRVVCTYMNVGRVECRTEEESKPEILTLPPV